MGWLLVLGLREDLVECATVCVKSEVILTHMYVGLYQQGRRKFWKSGGKGASINVVGMICLPGNIWGDDRPPPLWPSGSYSPNMYVIRTLYVMVAVVPFRCWSRTISRPSWDVFFKMASSEGGAIKNLILAALRASQWIVTT